MSLISEIKEKVASAEQKAVNAIPEAFRESKLKDSIDEEEKTISQLQQQIGEIVSNDYADMEIDPAITEQCKLLQESRERISKYEEEINSIQNVKICPQCESYCDLSHSFCPQCGCALPSVEDTKEDSKPDTAKFCTNCGTLLKEGAEFCTECGQHVALPVDSEYIEPTSMPPEVYTDKTNDDVHGSNSQQSKVKDFFKGPGGRILIPVLCAILIWGLMALCLVTGNSPFGLIIAGVCVFFGWSALNRIQPVMFIWMSWIGWLIYFMVKLALSAVIGLFVTPFVIGKKLGEHIHSSIQ